MHRAEDLCDLIQQIMKFPSEENESRHSHRHALVVQNLPTQWLVIPIKTQTCQETKKIRLKFLEPTRLPAINMRKFQDLLSDGKTPHERLFGMLIDGPKIPFGALVEYDPVPSKDISRVHAIRSICLCQGYSSFMYGTREESGKGDTMIVDIEELEEADASELHARKAQSKGIVNAARKWTLHLPSRRWNCQNF